MTWTGRLHVDAIDEVDDESYTIIATATSDETWTPEGARSFSAGEEVAPTAYPRLSSNTEGNVTKVEVRITVRSPECKVAVGDDLPASGHFG